MTTPIIKMMLEGRCPCGGKFMVAKDMPAVAHTAPTCVFFDDLEPDEYLTYVRKFHEASTL